MPKNVQTTAQLHSSHSLARQRSKILQVRLHEPRTPRCTSWIQERSRNQRSNCQHSLDHRKSKRIPGKKKNIFVSLTTLKPLCGSQQTVEDSEREGNTRPLYTPPKKSVCRSKQQLEPNTEQQTSSKLGKEQVKAVYFTLPI